MRTKTGPNGSADKHVQEIKRETRRQFSAEEKIRKDAEQLHSQAGAVRAMKSNAAIVISWIIKFGREAASLFGALTPADQDAAFEAQI